MKVYDGIEGLGAAAGDALGRSDWLVVDQARIDLFAEATGDHQWIHVDPQRASASDYGTTIAHGFLTLSLVPPLINQLYRVENVTMRINYGLDKVRFVAPVRAGNKVRLAATVLSVFPTEGAVQATFGSLIEIEGSAKPAASVESIVRFVA